MSDGLEYLNDLPPVGPAKIHEVAGGGRLGWDEYGDSSGKPVVFYHGWPSSRLQGRMVHHLAAARGLRVIAVDRPGIGRSSFVANRRLGDFAPLLESLLDRLGIGRFGQLGVSGGGPYVVAGVDYFRERVAGSAVLCGAVPLAGVARAGLHPVYRLLIPLRRLPAGLFVPVLGLGRWYARGEVSAGSAWRLLLGTLPAADREILLGRREVLPVFFESFREGARQGPAGVLADAEIYLQDWGIDLGGLCGEIRYWQGEADGNIPGGLVKEFVARVGGASLVVDAGEGHFSLALRRAPAALDFLQGCAPG